MLGFNLTQCLHNNSLLRGNDYDSFKIIKIGL